MARLSTLFSLFLILVLASCARTPPPGPQQTGRIISGANPRLGDDKPHAWIGGHPYNHPVHGVDVSRWQGDINWQQLRGAGIRFAFIKATEGGDHSDPAFQRYWRDSAAAGMPRGAYHYYYFCRSGAEQAAWFIANVPRTGPRLPPVIDLEWTHTSQTCRYKPSPDEVRREASIFMSVLQQYYGHRPIIYTTVDFYRDNDLGRMNEEFWLRSVAGHPREVYPGQRWTFWQYTGTGRAPGVAGRIDLNAFAGSEADWQRWLKARLR